jgi:hypothetical protein
LVIVYVLATLITDAYFMGDTWIYVNEIARAGSLGATFWDFGHPLWRPIGWLVWQPVSRLAVRGEPHASVTLTLFALNWIAGLVGVLIVYSIASKFCKNRWLIYAVPCVFLFSNAILNYSQTGQPYMPGITLLFLGLHLLLKEEGTSGHVGLSAVWAGGSLALAVCQWLPLILSLPAVLLSPLLMFGFSKTRLRLIIHTVIVISVVIGAVYLLMILNLRIHDIDGLKAWIGSSSHGVMPDPPLKAIQRMFFALARNLINMGNDGRLFKRYIVHDPFSPVSVYDLFRFSLWKLGLFYIFLSSLLFSLLLSRTGKRMLFLLFFNALPVLIFAVFLFESGSIDRYLPIFPMLFLGLAVSLDNVNRLRSWHGAIVLIFLAAVIVSNVPAMSTRVLHQEQESVAIRLRDLVPLLNRNSRVVVVNQQDEAYAFNQNFPFNPINRSGNFDADILVDPGTTQISRWQQIFASKTLTLWDKGGDVWITKRVLAPRPVSEWNWVEGDDPRVSWSDIHDLFSKFEMGQSIGGEDGFVLVLPSTSNRRLLEEIGQGPTHR